MIPKTFSATSLTAAQTCLARYHAEYIERLRSPANDAALLGSSIHGALEFWVDQAIIRKSIDPTWENLSDSYRVSFEEWFKIPSEGNPLYVEGRSITKKWFDRTVFDDSFTVLSVERKETFNIPTIVGDIPFTYIWDRCDNLGDGVIKIVDYKSSRIPIKSDDLRNKLQARAYALAAQIKFKEAKKIWVEFDMLRYEAVGTVFTREDNIRTWQYLKAETERILLAEQAFDNGTPMPATLNRDCAYCPIKATCGELVKTIKIGGAHSLTADELVELKLKVQSQLSGLRSLDAELDALISAEMEQRDQFDWTTPRGFNISFSARKTRAADKTIIMNVVGPDLTKKYGKFNITDIDKMLKVESLTDEQRKAIQNAIYNEYSEPKPKIKPPDFI